MFFRTVAMKKATCCDVAPYGSYGIFGFFPTLSVWSADTLTAL
jgi:hypothetical protein